MNPLSLRCLGAAWPLAAALSCLPGCESKKVPEPGATPEAPQPKPSSSAPSSGSSAASGATESQAGSALAAATELPKGSARFAWKAPMSVAVQEDVNQEGQRMQFAYHLDVCPGAGGGVLVSHRGVTVTKINGQSMAGKAPTAEVRQIEAAASALPTMVIDRAGVFLRGAGYSEMIKHANTAFPGKEFADLRAFMASGKAPAILDVTLAQLWQSWVGVWMRYEPSRGKTQEASDLDAGASASRIQMGFGGTTTDGHVKLAAHRVPTQEELIKLAGATGSMNPEQASKTTQAAVLDWEGEVDWPSVRPWTVHSRRSATFNVQGQEKEVVEEHSYHFDWSAADAGAPQCTP